jgi:DNA replication initiation complex subunit (GINS family)
MADDGISYESLKNRWQREVSTGPQELTRLHPSFYERVEAHLDELEEEYQREHEIDPTSGKAMLLQDELFNLRKILEDLYDQRERKVLMLALTAARGGDPDRSNMTDGEEELFESVVDALDEGRRRILRRHERDLEEDAPKASPVPDDQPTDPPEEPLDQYDEDETPPAPDRDAPPDPTQPPSQEPDEAGDGASTEATHPREVQETAAPQEVAPEAATGDEPPSAPEDRTGRRPEPADEAPGDEALGPGDDEATGAEVEEASTNGAIPDAPTTGRVVVRVLEGVQPFAASDMRTYDLDEEDVACLPPKAARTLVDREKAEVLAGEIED